jgi:hypothetical protein
MDTVLIADRDLGFVFWLGEKLGKLGYQALPAMNLSQATTLAKKLPIDVLVLSPAFPNVPGLLKSLGRFQKSVRILALPDAEPRFEKLRNFEADLRDAPEMDVFLRERKVNRRAAGLSRLTTSRKLSFNRRRSERAAAIMTAPVPALPH